VVVGLGQSVTAATMRSAVSARWVKQWARPVRGRMRSGVFGFGDAELGQQVQVVAQGLQFGVGLGGQVVAGMGGRSVLHGGVLPRAGCRACLRARGAPVGCREVRNRSQPAGIFPLRVLY
jgi:hypothetical protein